MPLNETLTAREVARYCNVHFRTVLRWIQRNELKAHQIPGRGDNRIFVGDFLAFLRQHDLPIPQDFAALSSRVLIVEDEPVLASAMRRMLERLGLEVAVASDGFRAGILVQTFQPAVVILDLSLPGLSGLEVLDYLKQSPLLKNIRVLVVSGEEEPVLQRAARSGADETMRKPLVNSSLIQKIKSLLPQPVDIPAGNPPLEATIAEMAAAPGFCTASH